MLHAYIYIYVCVYVYICICVYVCMYIHIYINIYTCYKKDNILMCVCVRASMCVRACVRACMRACVHVWPADLFQVKRLPNPGLDKYYDCA